MTVKELLLTTNFDEIFEALKRDIGVFHDVLQEDMEKANVFIERFYKRAIKDFVNINSNKQSENIIVVVKYIDEFSEIGKDEDWFVALNYLKSDLNDYIENKTNTIGSYDLEFLDWKEITNMEVWQRSINEYGKATVAATILHKITFFGCEYEKVKESVNKEIEKLKNQIEEIENGTVITYTWEEVKEMLKANIDIEFSEPTKEEEEKERKNIERIMKINEERKNKILKI